MVVACCAGFRALVAIAVSGAAAAAPGDRNPEIAKIVAEVSPQRMEATIRKLVSFGTRNSLSETKSDTHGIGAARRWIKSELERCSKESGGRLQVAFDEHHVESGNRVPRPTDFVNVVATLPGEQPESRDRIYVISGHYDTMPTDPSDGESDAPGADDDGSGTAISMELACVMSRHHFDATLVFMTVAGEEQGLYGSTGWAKAAREKQLNIAGMITNDIVGSPRGADGRTDRGHVRPFAEGVPPRGDLSDETRRLLRTGAENDLPTRQLARYAKEVGERYVPAMKVNAIWRLDRYLRGGDHFPFVAEGYPAVRFTESIEDWRHQHQNVRVENGVQFGDLPEFVDFSYLGDVARINAAVLASLALSPSAPHEVEMESVKLEADSTLRWKANPEPDVAGYRVVWRETTAPFWQQSRDVGNVTRYTVEGVSKDDYVLAVQAYDRDGNLSVASYPKPYYGPPRAPAK